MTEKDKQKYVVLQQKDQERHDLQLSQLRNKGFFMTEDGVKSTTLPQPSPKKKRAASKTPLAHEPATKKAKKWTCKYSKHTKL